jgi:hypothetical protein
MLQSSRAHAGQRQGGRPRLQQRSARQSRVARGHAAATPCILLTNGEGHLALRNE